MAYDHGAAGRLPDKEPGKHRWIALATYVLSNQQAKRAYRGIRVDLDHENRLGAHVGCIDCERPYELKDEPCDAAAYDWDSGEQAGRVPSPQRAEEQPMRPVSSIDVISGVSAFDGSGFIQLQFDGQSIGQLAPDELRDMAMNFLGAAEAAEQDAIVWKILRDKVGMDENAASAFLVQMREARE